MGQKLTTAYRFDKNGYYICETFVQPRPNGQLNIPDDCTLVAPSFLEGYWHKFDKESQTWIDVKKPATPEEVIAIGTVSHTSQTPHDQELRQLLQDIHKANSDKYKIDRGDNLSWTLSVIPEKTKEELALEAAEESKQEALRNLQKTDYVAAKIAEGVATKEEYAEVLAQRQEWRNQVNAADAQILSFTSEEAE